MPHIVRGDCERPFRPVKRKRRITSESDSTMMLSPSSSAGRRTARRTSGSVGCRKSTELRTTDSPAPSDWEATPSDAAASVWTPTLCGADDAAVSVWVAWWRDGRFRSLGSRRTWTCPFSLVDFRPRNFEINKIFFPRYRCETIKSNPNFLDLFI